MNYFRDNSEKPKRILVIPDAHAHPDVPNDRFEWLGRFIVDKKPDIIISIGDWADMNSLSGFDKGTVLAEGQRYVRDIQVANEALELTMRPVIAEVERLKKGKRKKWNPKFYVTLGNHENRIVRAQMSDPAMLGAFGLGDFDFKKWGWEVVPFLKPLVVQNIVFQHYLVSGVMGKPVGGVNHARSLVLKGNMSVVVGHSHMYDWWENVRADYGKLFGCVVGCFEDIEHTPPYAQSTAHHWWSGLVMLNDAVDGYAEPARYSFEYLKQRYS